MKFLSSAFPFGGLGLLGGLLKGKKKDKPPTYGDGQNPDGSMSAAGSTSQDPSLLRRRGGAADMMGNQVP